MTTFGGHPVCCAAGLAAFEVLLDESLTEQVAEKEHLFHQLLIHPKIVALRSSGLLMALELENNQKVLSVLAMCLEKGLFSDWFLFADHCIRIAPPLTITKDEIIKACAIIISCL
jgi:acetylornithine/succinyldiaminopimelate/putrescine aminotransferase